MIIVRWLLRCILVGATVHATSNGHDLQEPLEAENLPRLRHSFTHQPPNVPYTGDVDERQHESLFALHRDLVNINSVSDHEYAVAIFLEDYLRSLNYTVERQHVGPLIKNVYPLSKVPSESDEECRQQQQQPPPLPRFNILAHPPSHRRTPVLLTTHIDTVPPFYPYSRHPATTDDTTMSVKKIWGRGSVDAKACIATQLHAAQSLLKQSLIPASSVSHLFVVGEEVGGDGMMIASSSLNLTWDSVIFGEPTELKLASGHKGIVIFTLTATGTAAHSGYPWLGASATSLLVKALAALESMPLPSSAKYGNSTLNIGTLHGGVAANVMAANATASIGIRVAGGSAEEVRKRVLETVNGAMNNTDCTDDKCSLAVHFYGGSYGPVDLDTDIPGFDTTTVNYATDVPNLQGQHKRYLYGPGSILVAHSDHEAVAPADLIAAVDGYKRIILHAVGGVVGARHDITFE